MWAGTVNVNIHPEDRFIYLSAKILQRMQRDCWLILKFWQLGVFFSAKDGWLGLKGTDDNQTQIYYGPFQGGGLVLLQCKIVYSSNYMILQHVDYLWVTIINRNNHRLLNPMCMWYHSGTSVNLAYCDIQYTSERMFYRTYHISVRGFLK